MANENGHRGHVPPQPPDEDEILVEFIGDEGAPSLSANMTSATRTKIDPEGAPVPHAPQGDPELAQKVAKLEDQLLRHRADFENYRRRQEREREEMRRQAVGSVIEGLLPALDNFDHALKQVENEIPQDHLQGLLVVREQMLGGLKHLGLQDIEAEGLPFDPALHEAVALVQRSDVPPMTVTAVFQRGYLLGGKLLRAARVQVSELPRGESDA